jgi:uncharacterized membrane protein
MTTKNTSTKSKNTSRKKSDEPEEPVWTYRGYKLKTSEFVTAMVHFFRAEVSRANVWRQRLDTTTNWAVVSTGATLSIAFSQPAIHHGIILLNTLLVMWFLFIEARRYRYYELWSYRVRLMETDFHAETNLLNGVSHTATNNHFVNAVEQVVDELDFISDFRTT